MLIFLVMQILLTGPFRISCRKTSVISIKIKCIATLISRLELILDVKSATLKISFYSLPSKEKSERLREMTEFQGIILQKLVIADKWASNSG